MINKLKKWYKGKYHPIVEYHEDGSKTRRLEPYHEPPLLAKIVKIICQFWVDHWKWLLSFLYVAYLKL
jgi:hypothetical protein